MTFVTATQKKLFYNLRKFIIDIYYKMSTISVESLIVDTATDIGLTSDLINGTYKNSSLTEFYRIMYILKLRIYQVMYTHNSIINNQL